MVKGSSSSKQVPKKVAFEQNHNGKGAKKVRWCKNGTNILQEKNRAECEKRK